MSLYTDQNSVIENKNREALLFSDLDQTAEGPASKGYVDNLLSADYRIRVFSPLVSVPGTTSGDGFVITTTGTGAGASMVATTGTDRVGVCQFSTGTTTTGRCSYGTPGNITRLSGGGVEFWEDIYIPTLSTGTERYQLLRGLVASSSAINQTNSAHFVYDEGRVSSGIVTGANWHCVTANNSSRTITDTAVAVAATTWIRLSISVNADGTEVVFKIDGGVVATHTTNIPTAAGREVGPGGFILKSAGTTARTFNLDSMDFIKVFS